MLRSWPRGGTPLPGYLEDHAAFAAGLLELYQTTFDPRWFEAARELAETILQHFADPTGGFFDTSDDHESLLLRPKTIHDGAQPSGGAMVAEVLIKLAEYTGEVRYAEAASTALAQVQPMMARAPLGFAYWLGALDLLLAPPQALAIVGEEGAEEMLAVLARAVAAEPGDGGGGRRRVDRQCGAPPRPDGAWWARDGLLVPWVRMRAACRDTGGACGGLGQRGRGLIPCAHGGR